MKDNRIKLGLYSSGDRWEKNTYNQLSACAMVKDAYVDIVPETKLATSFCKLMNIKRLNDEPTMALSREELLKRMAKNTVNLYVTFTECSPMIPLESFELGVPCIIGNNTDFFKNSELEELVVVKEEDSIDEIYEKINIAIENKVGTLILKNSTIELGNETNSNKIINSDITNIINSEIYSDFENNGSLYTVDISNDDKTGINRFNNIINKGDTNLTSSNDIINNLTNDNTVQTNNTTEFEGTVTNNENATITTNGNTTFNIIENKGLIKLNDSNNAQNITNNGTINIFGTSEINELTNNSEFTSSGKLEVNTLENNGNIITKINTTITQLTNNASINTSGTTIISQLENNDTAEFYDNTTITTLVNNSNTLLQGINNVTTIKNNGLSNDNKASLNLWGTNLINSTTSNIFNFISNQIHLHP